MTLNKYAKGVLDYKDFKHLQLIEEFACNLEKGDIALTKLIYYAFVLYGQTKTGKTVLGHYLSGSSLKGGKIKGENMVEVTTSKNKKAKVGNQGNSETLIPNLFEVKLKNGKYAQSKTYVIDTPGYGDSYGVLRILANGYYHYRLYSKVKNMKFILCVDRSHLTGTADKFIDTVKQFTSSFKNYLDEKEQIWKSCALFVTKVEQSEEPLKDLQEKLLDMAKNLGTQLVEQQDSAFREFIKYIVGSKKLLFIQKIKPGQTPQNKGYLQNIDQIVQKWYSRQLSGNQQVDMSNISFSVAKQVVLSTTSLQKSKQQYAELVNFYNLRIKQLFEQYRPNSPAQAKTNSLSYVLQQLVLDCMGSPQSHNFLNKMASFLQQKYAKFDIFYKQQRQILQKQLFQITNLQTSSESSQKTPKIQKQVVPRPQNPNPPLISMDHNCTLSRIQSSRNHSIQKIKDKNYIVKKFQVLKNIQKLKFNLNNLVQKEQSIERIKEEAKIVYKIVKQFNKICYKRSKSTQIIYKFGYIIHRIFEEVKVFVMMIKSSSSQDILKTINQQFKPIQISLQLKDFAGIQYVDQNNDPTNYEKLHNQYVKKFNTDCIEVEKIRMNQSLLTFFSQVNNSDHDKDLTLKIINLALRYSDQILEENLNQLDLKADQRNRIILKLAVSIKDCKKLFYATDQSDEKADFAILLRKISKNLGKIFELEKKFIMARKVYESIKFVPSVCRMYQCELQKDPNDISLRIQFSKYMAGHLRQQQAIQLLQETFQIAETKEDLKRVKHEISDLRQILRQNKFNPYQQFLFNEDYFEEFNPQFQDQLAPKLEAKKQKE